MININECIRNRKEAVIAFKKRGLSTELLDDLIALENKRKKGQKEIEVLQVKRNQLTQSIRKNPQEAGSQKEGVKIIKQQIVHLEEIQNEIEKQLKKISLRIPNFPEKDVHEGQSEKENKIIYSSPDKQKITEQKPHWEIDKASRLLDFKRGVKLSGSRFYVMYGEFAQLQRALIQYLLKTLQEAGFLEVTLPYMVHQDALLAAGQLPKFAENLYHDIEEDFWWIPTAEVPLTALHQDEILEADSLPKLYCAHTACFRREKASAGKDGRGMKRGHQFDKVEMFSFCKPDQAEGIFNKMVDIAKKICTELELPYQLKSLCTGDLGFAASKTIDVEVWAAGCQEWLEVSSISMCRDFQSRRAKVRYREGKEKALCDTLNGSCLGIPRTMIALIENNQQKDNSILVPEPLQPWTGFKKIQVN
ncbi:MAG: serine--tRNA ligase [bacterium]